MKVKYEVEIDNVNVDLYYYSFEYRLYKDDSLIKEGIYDSDHGWQSSIQDYKEMLENGYAAKIILQDI